MLKAPGSERLKLRCEDLLSKYAFSFNLRRYTEAKANADMAAADAAAAAAAAAAEAAVAEADAEAAATAAQGGRSVENIAPSISETSNEIVDSLMGKIGGGGNPPLPILPIRKIIIRRGAAASSCRLKHVWKAPGSRACD
jgi:hypothetical protein